MKQLCAVLFAVLAVACGGTSAQNTNRIDPTFYGSWRGTEQLTYTNDAGTEVTILSRDATVIISNSGGADVITGYCSAGSGELELRPTTSGAATMSVYPAPECPEFTTSDRTVVLSGFVLSVPTNGQASITVLGNVAVSSELHDLHGSFTLTRI